MSLPVLVNMPPEFDVVVGEGVADEETVAEEETVLKGRDMVERKGTESVGTFMGVNGAVCGRV